MIEQTQHPKPRQWHTRQIDLRPTTTSMAQPPKSSSHHCACVALIGTSPSPFNESQGLGHKDELFTLRVHMLYSHRLQKSLSGMEHSSTPMGIVMML